MVKIQKTIPDNQLVKKFLEGFPQYDLPCKVVTFPKHAKNSGLYIYCPIRPTCSLVWHIAAKLQFKDNNHLLLFCQLYSLKIVNQDDDIYDDLHEGFPVNPNWQDKHSYLTNGAKNVQSQPRANRKFVRIS